MSQIVRKPLLDTSKVTVELRNYNFEAPFERSRRESSRSLLGLCLTPRLGTQGRMYNASATSPTEHLGEMIFLPAGATWKNGSPAGKARFLVCFVDVDLFKPDAEDLSEVALAEALHVRHRASRHGLLRIMREVRQPGRDTDRLVEALAKVAIIDLNSHLLRCAERSKAKAGGLSGAQLRVIEERVCGTLRMLTTIEIADACDLSTGHLMRAFQQETGRTLGDYVWAVGLGRAKHLLENSRLPVKAIASALGYSSSASFGYAIRCATGFTPLELRAHARVSAAAAANPLDEARAIRLPARLNA